MAEREYFATDRQVEEERLLEQGRVLDPLTSSADVDTAGFASVSPTVARGERSNLDIRGLP